MNAWQELTTAEADAIWDRVRAELSFRTGLTKADWPGIVEPSPFVTYRFEYPLEEETIEELHAVTLEAFRACLHSGDRMYALDCHHPCYWFSPHVPLQNWNGPGFWEDTLSPGAEVAPSDRWVVPVLPNGDYYIFLSHDLSWGLFGHPWEQTICTFGEPLLRAFAGREPKLFADVFRRS